MSDWKAQRAALLEAADSGDVVAVRDQLGALLAVEQSPRVFALGSRLLASLRTSSRAGELVAVRLLILRSYTVEPLVAPLQTFALTRGLALECDVAAYDQFEPVLAAEQPAPPDVVLFIATLSAHAPELAAGFASLETDAVAERIAAAPQRARGWLDGARRAWPMATPILAGVVQPARRWLGTADSGLAISERRTTDEINEGLRQAAREHSDAMFFDVDEVVSGVGRQHAHDARMWAHARQPYAPAALAALADRLTRLLAARMTRRRKCLVLDCDNTLWGGVIGEDGMSGIALGPEHPGASYVEFQRALLALYERGIILTLASKNNEADVLEVLTDHRHQVLRPEHIAAHEIGWGDKASSIKRLAGALNIGTDSMVFIDDSDYECALVRERLPEVEVVQAPANPLELVSTLASIESLDALRISRDDRKRGAMYKAQSARSAAQEQAASLDSFLHSLELEIEIRDVVEPGEIERAAQLCQRTNQLNVTTRRHQVADIEAFVADPSMLVRIARLRDRFGDYGMCGLVIASIDGDGCDIDTLLLSCRVIGRGVEEALGVDLEHAALERGVSRLVGLFVPTAKNEPAADLFGRLGFHPVGAGDNDGSVRVQKSLDEGRRPYPDWFKVVV